MFAGDPEGALELEDATMPIHDWRRVSAGTFHAFHNGWITHLQETLNAGLLPESYYALGEQAAGDIGADLLTLHVDESEPGETGESGAPPAGAGGEGMVAVSESPPKVQFAQEAKGDLAFYLSRRRSLVIRHATGDRIVAVIEILSPANKHSRETLERFVDKVVASLRDGVHLLVIDLFPPTSTDPNGIHGAVWDRLLAGPYEAPRAEPLTLVSYRATKPLRAYVEPTCVGKPLSAMPLFLTADHYVSVPLEKTYAESWVGVPARWRGALESGASS